MLPRTVSHRILPSRSLTRSKSALLKSRVAILLFVLLPLRILNSTTLSLLQPRWPPILTSLTSSSCFASMRCSRVSSSCLFLESRNFLDCLWPPILSFQQILGWFKSHTRTRAFEHEASFNCLKKTSSTS